MTQILFSLHLVAAQKVPELQLEEKEAEQLAKAYAALAEFYPVLRQSDKAMAWSNMLAAVGMVYGTRAVAVFNNARKKPDAADNVTPLKFTNPQPPRQGF